MKKYICVIISIIVLMVSLIILYKHNVIKEQIIIKTDNNKQVNMENYMRNVIYSEMGEYCDYEAIKAFCVVIRTNIIYSFIEEGDNIIDNKLSNQMGTELAYNNITKKNEIDNNIILKAINETKGEVVLYRNRIVYLPYHKVSSGKTVNKEINNGAVIPYLKTANCSEDIENKEYLKIYYCDIRHDTEEVKKSIIKNLKGSHISYNLDEGDDRIRIVTQGTGHNFGMSLYNAYVMSKKGYTYKEILNKYYNAIRIVKVYE